MISIILFATSLFAQSGTSEIRDAGNFKIKRSETTSNSFQIDLLDPALKKPVTKKSKVIALWVDSQGKPVRGPDIFCDKTRDHFNCQWNQKMLPDPDAKIRIKATRLGKIGASVDF